MVGHGTAPIKCCTGAESARKVLRSSDEARGVCQRVRRKTAGTCVFACGLPESIDDHTATFDCGPARLSKVPTATASTDFDTAVALLDLVMEALSISAKRGLTASENQ
jgi:hypothetical protein